MNNRNWVENMIWSIIMLNFMVLTYVFLIPRAQFMIDHWGWNSESLMETSGAMDTPNQYFKTYKIANFIQKITEEDSVILMPTDNWEFGSNRSVVIQRLYPRKIYFFGDEGFLHHKNSPNYKTPNYAVAFPGDGSDLCFEKDINSLGETGFLLCKWKH